MGSADTRHFPELDGAALSAVIGACAVVIAGGVALPVLQLGPTSWHMAVHVALMNVVAPFAAVGFARRRKSRLPGVGWKALWLATLVQMGMLWMSHSPPIHHAAHSSITAFAALHAAIFASAAAFWAGIVASPSRWQAMLALLVSGKLACLLAALLIFSPRILLVASHAHADHATASGPSPLDDQHLAGLLMIAACPLSYVLAAIVLAAHTMTTLERVPTPAFPNGAGAGCGPR